MTVHSPFALYCSPGEHKFDEEHTFGVTVVDESAVSVYLETGKWFMNTREAVDALIREQVDEPLGIDPEGTSEPEADKPNVTSSPDWATDEEIERVKANDNEARDNKRSPRRNRYQSSDL